MIKVFIVDDHVLIREGLRGVLDDTRIFEITGEASSTNEALEQLCHLECDIALLDISLPGKDGLELLEIIKQLYPQIHPLILSMHPVDQFAIRSLRAGASGYLSKDDTPDTLVGAIHTVMERGKYISPAVAELLACSLEGSGLDSPHDMLSNRELEIMNKLSRGVSARDIADELSLSLSTVNSYRTRILEKMNMKSNTELTFYSIRHGLIEVQP